MNTACTSEPISWLRLEQYHLDELSESEAQHIHVHLEQCPACQQCADMMEADAGVDWDAVVGEPPHQERPKVLDFQAAEKARRPARIASAVAGALALAAAALLFFKPPAIEQMPGHTFGVKGGDVMITLVRERDGSVSQNPERFLTQDRFKVLISCPPGFASDWEVVVFQGGEAFFPLESVSGFECGNSVAVEGAFRLTDSVTTAVCVVWSEDAYPVRARADLMSPRDLGSSAVCRTVEPAE